MIPLFVTAHGAVTSLGLDAARTVASLRGGLDALTVLPLAAVTEEDLRVHPVDGFAGGLLGADRFVALAERALGECIEELNRQEPRNPAIFLGLPVPGTRPGLDPQLEMILRDAIERRFNLPAGTVRVIGEGRTSVFTAIKQAEAWLRSGPHACIVGGVDTLLHPDDLQELSRRGVLAEEYDGFYPGEAAAFLCLSRRTTTGPLGRKAAAVVGFGEAIEPADGTAQHPLVGVGLAAAMRKAVAEAGVSLDRLGLYINSVNGARAEWEDDAHARIRLLRVAPTAAAQVRHLASYMGEVGAAYGALALLWASAIAELGLDPAQVSLLVASEGVRRNALLVQATPGEIVDRERAPAVSLGEPALHARLPIAATSTIADDPGIRLEGIDDRHGYLAGRDFEQLASLIVVRDGHLRSHSPWTDIEAFERRALAHVDALAWSGGFVRELAAQKLRGESEDAAAATLVLCCAPPSGGEIELLLDACEQSDEHRSRIAATAAVCPRGVADQFLLRLAEKGADGLRDAVWALGVAQWATADWLHQMAQRLGHPTPDLIAAIGGTTDAHNAWPLQWLISGGTPLPLDAAMAGMVVQDPRTWIDSFRLDEALEVMPEALGVGALQSGRRLWPTLPTKNAPTRGTVVALGWSGEVEGAPLLLEALSSEDEEVAEEAARSLARIYGVRPIETVVQEIPPDAADEDDEEEEEDDAEAESKPPIGPPSRKSDRLSRNRAQWEEALKNAPVGQAGRQRPWRSGQPWNRNSALQMLLGPRTPCSDRVVAIWEHAITTRRPLAVHTRQWVARQRRLLTAEAPSA